MMRFNIHAPKRSVSDRKDVYIIRGKQDTYFAVHRTLMRPDNDIVCTKTCILSFTTPYHASVFTSYLQNAQDRKISVVHRDISNDEIVLEMPLEKKVNFTVSSCPRTYLEYLCLLHHFDLYLVHNVRKQPSNALDVDCIGYQTKDYPDTWMLKSMLESLMVSNER